MSLWEIPNLEPRDIGIMPAYRLRRWPNIKPVSDPGLNPAVSLTVPAPQSVLTLIRRHGPEIADYLHRELV